MKTKLYKKSFTTKTALDNFSQTFQGKKRTIIECGNSCTRQNATCNAIHYDHDTQVCSMWNMDSNYCSHPEFHSSFRTPDGQTEELMGMFFGAELLRISCQCNNINGTPCLFPFQHKYWTYNRIAKGCIPSREEPEKFICAKETYSDHTMKPGSLRFCNMENAACNVDDGF